MGARSLYLRVLPTGPLLSSQGGGPGCFVLRYFHLTIPPWLDRIWLWAIGLSFAFIVPLWLILSVERLGWRIVAAVLTLALFIRLRRTARPQ